MVRQSEDICKSGSRFSNSDKILQYCASDVFQTTSDYFPTDIFPIQTYPFGYVKKDLLSFI